ncbi:MAG: trypsin-like peptidase domain-containing protein, partial [Rhizobacter sp.]|nr:trypsin-like peptidase domain-containing protein [Rhizobacter sp.]
QLLALGGQEAAAQQVMARARARLPGDALLVDAPQAPACQPRTGRAAPPAVSPMPLGEAPAHNAAVVASGVLLADGRHALVPARALEGAQRVWLRNGLGRSTRAELVRHDASGGVTLLRLLTPLDAPADLAVAPREAFAGSQAFVVGYRIDTTGRPAWPQLCLGFLAAVPGHDGPRPLGMALPEGSAGAPVFDSAGRLVGMALPGDTPALLTAQHFGVDVALPTSAGATALPLDELYERALRVSLQVLRE